MHAIHRIDLDHPALEAVWVEVKPKGCKSLLLCNCYRPPASLDSWFDHFEHIMGRAQSINAEVMVMGDFNVDTSQSSHN